MTRSFLKATFFATALILAAMPAFSQIVVDDFTKSKQGHFPSGWRSWPLQGDKTHEVYTTGQEGKNRYLQAEDAKGYSVQIYKKLYWDLNEYPTFSWRWRANAIPAGARENEGGANDSACGVYIIFSQIRQHAIKYVWSSTLPVNTTVPKSGKPMHFVVLDSGTKKKGQWQTKIVNLKDDYIRLFHEAPPGVVGIGILTDGNATHQTASCDYDDFVRSK